MKEAEVRRYVNEDVVGQRLDGLFIEGHVEERDRVPYVVPEDNDGKGVPHDQIRWLARSCRYC